MDVDHRMKTHTFLLLMMYDPKQKYSLVQSGLKARMTRQQSLRDGDKGHITGIERGQMPCENGSIPRRLVSQRAQTRVKLGMSFP